MPILGVVSSSILKVNNAFESIATATGTGSSTTITFSSIPQTYTHLQIRGIARDGFASTGLDYVNIKLVNNDSGSNYNYHYIRATPAGTVQAGSATSTTYITPWYSTFLGSALTNAMAVSIIDILDYTSTSKNKTFRMVSGGNSNGTDSGISLGSGTWFSNSAITSISLVSGGTGLTTSTTFALYGIKES